MHYIYTHTQIYIYTYDVSLAYVYTPRPLIFPRSHCPLYVSFFLNVYRPSPSIMSPRNVPTYLYVCMYVCMYVCIAHVPVCIYVCMYAYICFFSRICKGPCRHQSCPPTYLYVCMYVCMHIYAFLLDYVETLVTVHDVMCACMYVCPAGHLHVTVHTCFT
jgi:hypothetical protein